MLSGKSFFFQYNEIFSTSKIPFNSLLVINYYNVFGIFFLKIMKFVLLIHSVGRLVCTYTVSIQYT